MASEGISTTSYWLNFFTSAGIPAGDAANYAVIFSDNRIKKDMLLDLSKEYLTDMGISRMGDIIAVLKHSKIIHSQDARDRALHGVGSLPHTLPVLPTPKRTTAASRTVNHYLQKEMRSASPSIETTTTLPVSSVQQRLGAPSTMISLSPRLQEVFPVPKTRRVYPELEGKYKVTMPSGSTAKTKKIIQKQKAAKSQGGRGVGGSAASQSTVFSRLGSESSSPQVTVTGLSKFKNLTATSSTPAAADETFGSSVFKRLGTQSTLKRAATSTIVGLDSDSEDEDSSSESEAVSPKSTVPYAGVLKSPSKKPNITIEAKLGSTKKALMTKSSALSRLGSQKSERHSEGIFACDTASSKDVRSRLGKVVSAADTSSAVVSSSMGISKKRVGSPSIIVTGLTPSPAALKKIALRVNMTSATRIMASKKTAFAKRKGIFGRLGNQANS